MDRLVEMELFVKTAELGTLSKAAEVLDISVAAASRCLSALEARLSVRLVERSTRRLALTPPGRGFYQRCKTLLAEIEAAESSVNLDLAELAGTLTITSSISFAKLHLAPLIPAFNVLHPRIKVRLLGENRYCDLIDSDIDLAIRTRESEPDSTITIRRLAESRRVLAASPEYLARHGVPQTVADLAAHKLLIYSYANRPNRLSFNKDGLTEDFQVDPALESNDGQILTSAALSGAGILVQPLYILQDDLDQGRLVTVLDDWHLPRLTINIAFQDRRYLAAKSRVFIDFLVEHFQARNLERRWLN